MTSSAVSQVLQGTSMLVTDESMPRVLARLEAADEIGIDTETTGLDVRYGTDYLMGIGVSVEGFMGYMPFRHEAHNLRKDWLGPLFKMLSPKPLIWHNRKFDWHSIKTLGVDPRILQGPQYDTLIIAHLVDEELPSKELDFLVKRFLNDAKYESDIIHRLGEIYGWKKIPAEVMAPYGAYDPYLTRLLKKNLWPKLVKQNLEEVYWTTEAPMTTSLYLMEQRGVGVNKDFAQKNAERGRGRMATIERQLKFNPASPKQLGEYLLEDLGLPILTNHLTPKGKPSFNKMAMEEYDELLQASKNPAAQLVAEFRGWQKATTSLYEPLLRKVGPDGRVRTNFKQHGTVTGRLSASEPNLQQVPRGSNKPWNGHAKSCFTSGKDGYILYGWDYSQIELRLAAAYGREQVLLAEFEKADSDPFRVLCEIIFGAFSEEGRHDTKTFVYANLYGAGLTKIAAQLGRTIAETKPLYTRYHRGISGIIEISNQVNQVMNQQGYVSYWDGRRRHIRKFDERHKAWNSVIQGGAAQLVKKAILRCEEFADSDCYPVLTVHDEITFVIKKEAISDYEPKITKAMTEFDWPVKLAIEGKEWK